MRDRIARLNAAFEAYGYVVTAEPIPGSEALFAETLKKALATVERTLHENAARYRYRGRSKNALAALHAAVPYPCFGVEAEK